MKYLILIHLCGLPFIAVGQKIILATYQYADNNRLENIRPLSKYLTDSLGVEVEIKSYPTVHAFIAGIQNDEIDIALINTFGFLLLETAQKKYEMKPYAVLKVKNGTENNYKTTIITKAESPIDSLTNLKEVASNLKLGLVNIGSTSGNLVPRLKLAAIGIDNPEAQFKTVEYCKNHKNTVDQLLTNMVDIAAVGSTEYFNLLADTNQAKSIKLLWLSPEIPLGPVLLHDRLPKPLQQKIINGLLNLDNTSPSTLEAIKSGWSEAKQAEKFIKIDHQYYTPFKKQFGNKKTMEKILTQFAN